MKENKNKQGEYIFLGCTLIGMGIGFFLDNLLVFMFICPAPTNWTSLRVSIVS